MALLEALATLSLAATPAPDENAAAHWRALTLIDVEAAHRMISEDHPGAAPEVGDEAFRRRLASAYATARERAGRVTSMDGHAATLAGFAVSLGDKHISSRPVYNKATVRWPGLLVARRGGRWIVVAEKAAAEGASLEGAALVSCDGLPADALAERRLGGFRIHWPIEAQRVQRAQWLLIDDSNPFLEPPKSCRFQPAAGPARDVTLSWRELPRAELPALLKPFPNRGAAGMGLRKVGEGWWIALETLSAGAVPVVEAVRAQAETLRAAPFVVLDMRGNSGGNSQYGQMIADALLGPARASARPVEGNACAKVWRVSERNLKQVTYYRDTLGPRMGSEALAYFTREHDSMVAAKTRGDRFTGPPRCGRTASAPPGPSISHARNRGRVVLLTDNSCFSSCLLVTDMFRRRGALHVGETTDANTNYMEVREDRLPSGLSMFSTLQAIAPAEPSQIGPFEPELRYEGSIADTAALERWIEGLVAER